MDNEKVSVLPLVLNIIGSVIIAVAVFAGWHTMIETQELIVSAMLGFGGVSSGVIFFAIGKIIELHQESVSNQEQILMKLNEGVQKLDYISRAAQMKK